MSVKPRITVKQLEERVAALEADNRSLRETVENLSELVSRTTKPQSQQAKSPHDVFETNRLLAIEKSKDDRYTFSEYELAFLRNAHVTPFPTEKQRKFMEGLAKKSSNGPQLPNFEYPRPPSSCLDIGDFGKFARAVGDYGDGSYIADRDGPIDLGLGGFSRDDDYDDHFSLD